MKKFLCLFLVGLMIFSLSACGDKTGTNSNNGGNGNSIQQDVVDVPKYNLDYDETFSFWGETDEISLPEIDALTWDEKEVDGVIQHKANSPIAFDAEEIVKNLCSNPFSRNLFENIYEYDSENHQGIDDSKHGYYTILKEYSNVSASNEDNHISLYTMAVKESDRFNGWQTIEFKISNLPIGEFTQDDIYSLAKYVFGDSADYLVYGKDADATSSRDGDTSEKYSLDALEMVDYVIHDESSYCLRRDVYKGEYKDTVTIFFGLRVYDNAHYDRYDYFFDDRSNLYVANAYTPDAVLSDNFGVTDPTKGQEFGVSVLNKHLPDFTTGKIEYWHTSTIQEEDGSIKYNFSIKDRYYSKKDNLQGNLWYNVEVESKNNEVQQLTLNVSLHWDTDEIAADSQEYIDKSIAIMKDILGIDIQPITYNGNFRNTQTVVINIDGTDYNAEFDVNHNAVSTGIDLSYKK